MVNKDFNTTKTHRLAGQAIILTARQQWAAGTHGGCRCATHSMTTLTGARKFSKILEIFSKQFQKE